MKMSGAQPSWRKNCQVAKQPIKTTSQKMKVTVKPLITYCDSTNKRLTQRKLGLPSYSIFPMVEGLWFRGG